MTKKTQKYILHIIGSFLFLCVPILASPDFHTDGTSLFQVPQFKRSVLAFILLLGFFYANYLYFIPRFYFKRKYLLFVAAIAGSFAFITYVPDLLIPSNFNPDAMFRREMQFQRELRQHQGGNDSTHIWHRQDSNNQNMPPQMGENGNFNPDNGMPPNGDDFKDMQPHRKWPRVPFFFLPAVLLFLLTFSLSFLLKVNERLGDIESEKLKTEVSYLKAQINPHFLFNTLNSLYALSLEKSDAAPEAILKLSGMMRYVVSESNREFVPLESELAYINNYISLQKLRMDDNTAFSYTTTGSATGKKISPLLLIPFIENAFKYGLNPEENSAIDIHITIEGESLTLNVKNNKVHTALPYEEHSGHGVENTRMRLQYLYAQKYELAINDKPETFEVALKIELV